MKRNATAYSRCNLAKVGVLSTFGRHDNSRNVIRHNGNRHSNENDTPHIIKLKIVMLELFWWRSLCRVLLVPNAVPYAKCRYGERRYSKRRVADFCRCEF
jgi:hypothetical protein